jgi:hypothetical protein
VAKGIINIDIILNSTYKRKKVGDAVVLQAQGVTLEKIKKESIEKKFTTTLLKARLRSSTSAGQLTRTKGIQTL